MILPALARLLATTCLLVSVAWAGDDFESLRRPVSADFSTLLENRTDVPMVFAYQGRRTITVIDFPSLTSQGRMFNRLVALIERIGAPRGQVLSNEELARFIKSVGKTDATLAYGNDFLVSELVVFFNLAEMGNVQLNREEIALRDFVNEQGLMALRNGFYQARVPSAVILSLPQERPADAANPPVSALARQTILAHELSHAEYYTNPAYANHCRRFWHTEMTEAQREAFRQFLTKGGYNPDNIEMMINETQAYLMHTPDVRAFSPRQVGLSDADVTRLRQKFRAAYPDMAYQ